MNDAGTRARGNPIDLANRRTQWAKRPGRRQLKAFGEQDGCEATEMSPRLSTTCAKRGVPMNVLEEWLAKGIRTSKALVGTYASDVEAVRCAPSTGEETV